MAVLGFLLIVIVIAGACFWLRYTLGGQRAAYLENYAFPPAIQRKLAIKYPHLEAHQIDRAMDALRDYFDCCNRAGWRRTVSMPSQIVDDAWHEFILFTRIYQRFCRRALGRFLHHTPAEAMTSPSVAQHGIKRAWRLACAKERIDPRKPERLPLLFAIDAELGIADGFRYALDCQDRNSPLFGSGYCASHIGCASGCGGDSGGCSDGGGCGGDGCGGGGGCGGD